MPSQVHPWIDIFIWLAFAFGGLLCLMNFSLPVRYSYRRWKKLPEEHVTSPIPILGSLFVLLSLWTLDALPLTRIIGWILIAIDVGGIHWMIFAMIYSALRVLFNRSQSPQSGNKWSDVNPVAALIFFLLALLWLVKAFL